MHTLVTVCESVLLSVQGNNIMKASSLDPGSQICQFRYVVPGGGNLIANEY